MTREQLLSQLVPEATSSYSASIARDTGIVEQSRDRSEEKFTETQEKFLSKVLILI